MIKPLSMPGKIKCQQKQAGYVAIGIKVVLGDFYTDNARLLADLIKIMGQRTAFSLRQNIVLRHIKEENLEFFYQELAKLGFVELGYDTTLDITACPERTPVTLVLPAVQVSLLN
jgi:sulfite reductase (ferredoxin)